MTPPASSTGPENTVDAYLCACYTAVLTNDNGRPDVLVLCLVEAVEHNEDAAKGDQEETTGDNEENQLSES